MNHLLFTLSTADFAKWKSAYDAHLETRAAAGLRELHLWRSLDEPNRLALLFEIADMGKARAFVASQDLREKMAAAGILGAPEVLFLAPA